MNAWLSPDGRTFVLEGGQEIGRWRGVYPVEDLPRQLRFYRGLRDRKGGAYAEFYEPTVMALEALARELAKAA